MSTDKISGEVPPAEKDGSLLDDIGRFDSIYMSDNPLMQDTPLLQEPLPSQHQSPSLLTRFMGSIPGFSGYGKKEKLFEDDKIQRFFIAERIDKMNSDLKALGAVLVKKYDFSNLSEIERLSGKMSMFSDKIRHASYSYDALARSNMDEVGMKLLFDYSVSMLDIVEKMEGKIAETLSLDSDSLKGGLSVFSSIVDELFDLFLKRDLYIKGGKLQ